MPRFRVSLDVTKGEHDHALMEVVDAADQALAIAAAKRVMAGGSHGVDLDEEWEWNVEELPPKV